MTAVQTDSYVEQCSSTERPSSIDVLADYFANIRREQEMYVKAGCAEADLTDCLATWFNIREQALDRTAARLHVRPHRVFRPERRQSNVEPAPIRQHSPSKPESLPAAGGQVNGAVLCHET